MPFVITKEFAFSASHILSGLPDGHPCGRMHGHNYIVRVEMRGDDLNGTGFVRDYGDLACVKRYIDGVLDHRHLNDVLACQPSAELLARHLFDRFAGELPELSAVEVSETPKTWARYSP